MSDTDYICLKYGTLKSWRIVSSPEAKAALERWVAFCEEATQEESTDEQRDLLCRLIQASNAPCIYLEWTGREVTRESAMEYVRSYGKSKVSA